MDPEILAMFPWYKYLAEGLDAGEAIPKIPEAMEIYNMIERHISDAVAGAATPQEALDKLQNEVADFLDERGY
jgi:ABC-type glycerol-3-phosphate transport system substrate-binding protein